MTPARKESAHPPDVSELDRRLDHQEDLLHALRTSVGDTDKRSVATLDLVLSSLRQFREDIPRVVESVVSGRIAELELRIQTEQNKLEGVLTEQSASIATLRTHAEDTDLNMQRLIAAVERICVAAPARAPVLSPAPPASANAGAAPPVAATVAAPVTSHPPAKRPVALTPPPPPREPERRRPRIPMARIF